MKMFRHLVLGLMPLALYSGSGLGNAPTLQANASCPSRIVFMTPGAVGNPCLTTEQFVQDLKLSKRESKALAFYMQHMNRVGHPKGNG